MPVARPPSADPLVALADRCVQCGLCLPACPTYGLDRLEAESPRGRIALVRAWALGTIETTVTGDAHLDHCLGCRSCEAVCPAGVEYGALLVAARKRQRLRRKPGWLSRSIEALVARPRLLAFALTSYRLVHGWLPASLRPLPRPQPSLPALASTPRTRDRQVSVFVGCVADTYEAGLRAALARWLDALGMTVVEPAGQACCGTLHAHSGDTGQAQRLAARNHTAFAGAHTVLTLASGCHGAVADALRGVRTVDAIEFLAEHAASLRFRRSDERVALHLPCTQRNVARSVPALRRLLAQVPGLSVVELDAGLGCCGAAGLQMIEAPARAAAFRAPLLDQLIQSKAARLLSANIGCRLHFAQATDVPVQHPLEFLAGLLEHGPLEHGPLEHGPLEHGPLEHGPLEPAPSPAAPDRTA